MSITSIVTYEIHLTPSHPEVAGGTYLQLIAPLLEALGGMLRILALANVLQISLIFAGGVVSATHFIERIPHEKD